MSHLFQQREDLFTIVGHPFTRVGSEALGMIKDRLIMRHRRHKGFSFSKENILECEKCDLVAEQTPNGWMFLEGNIFKYIIDVTAAEEEREYSHRLCDK